jgi:hypothetical protein
VSKFLIAATVASALLFACTKRDPFDQAFIQKDLQKRTAQDVHGAADKFSYDPPADRLLTEKQIADHVQVMKLADEIRRVAERSANGHVDRASAAGTGAARFGESMAAFGSVRAYATADLRASLNLGLNPKEDEWVGRRVATALDTIESIMRLENGITAKKAEMDAEIDPMLMTTKRHRYEAAMDAKQRWENDQDPATLANAELVRKHRHELVPAPLDRP